MSGPFIAICRDTEVVILGCYTLKEDAKARAMDHATRWFKSLSGHIEANARWADGPDPTRDELVAFLKEHNYRIVVVMMDVGVHFRPECDGWHWADEWVIKPPEEAIEAAGLDHDFSGDPPTGE